MISFQLNVHGITLSAQKMRQTGAQNSNVVNVDFIDAPRL